MIKKFLIFTALFFNGFIAPADEIILETTWFRLGFSGKGFVTTIYDKSGKKEYLPAGRSAPLLSIRFNGIIEEPCQLRRSGNILVLDYPNKAEATIKPEIKKDYISFELVEILWADSVELVIWGPYPTIIGESVGECVGVVRNSNFSIGIQALNVKTLGGYPGEESDIEPSYDIFATGNYADIESDWKNKKHYRGQTARVAEYGSVLQAYTRNRNKERIIANWGHTHYVAPSFNDGGVAGSKIALFGCPEEKTLELIGQIEIAEGLPHPVIEGEWAKISRGATSSYLIMDFTEKNLDQALELTRKAGLKYLYHGHPFKSWGHFDLLEDAFPDNWTSMKRCVDRAAEQGIMLGVHTLSNFINTNDPYVTPVPDKRLAKVGESIIKHDIDKQTDEIIIESPLFFSQMENNTLKAAVIGNEIIRYREVTQSEPWKLTGCVRGAFGTVTSEHRKGAVIGKLLDHPYKVFLSDPGLSAEISTRIANLFNETGLRQISFDGLEGVWSTGMGQYARALFTKTWYDNLKPELRGKVINDASNPGHFNWHINTRYNWGEPWYAGFRESQTYYRLMNQDFYRRNFIPPMLGWFSMSASTSTEDAEWLLARAAGFDAGFAFNLSMRNVERNGASSAIFEAIRTWETARMAGAFTPELKILLQDISNEFHLEEAGVGEWLLYPFKTERYVHEQKSRQPGEPLHSIMEFNNPYEAQNMIFIISLVPGKDETGVKAESIYLEINNHDRIEIPAGMEANQNLILNPDGRLILYDANWNVIRHIQSTSEIPGLLSGLNRILVDADFSDEGRSTLKIELKTRGNAYKLKI